MQIPLDEAKPENWISTERTKRRPTPPHPARELHTLLWLQEVGEVQGRTQRSGSLTVECQDIAAGTRQDDYSPWDGIKPGLGMYIVCMEMVRFEKHYTDGEIPYNIHQPGEWESRNFPGAIRVWLSRDSVRSKYVAPVFTIKLCTVHASRLPTQNLCVVQTKLQQHVWSLKFPSVVNYILAWLLSTLLSKDKTQWHQFFPQMPLLSSCSLLTQMSDSCSFP